MNTIKQSHQLNEPQNINNYRDHKHLSHSISACNDLTIIQNISSDQLDLLEKTYKYMLEAIKEARRTKNKTERMQAESIIHNKQHVPIYNRQCIKIAYLWDKGIKSKEIDRIMGKKSGYSLNRVLASHGRHLKHDLWLAAKRNMVIKFMSAGLGVRPTSRAIPAAIGTCSPALVCKIMKAEKMKKQAPLPFPLQSV